jgi:hypothetical protein
MISKVVYDRKNITLTPLPIGRIQALSRLNQAKIAGTGIIFDWDSHYTTRSRNFDTTQYDTLLSRELHALYQINMA